jgi:hypothetical protein
MLPAERQALATERRACIGGIDLYIGPKAPAGFEMNHMKTVGDDGWFVYFRPMRRSSPSSTRRSVSATSNGSTNSYAKRTRALSVSVPLLAALPGAD